MHVLYVSQTTLVAYRRARAVRITDHSCGIPACTCCAYQISLLWHIGVHVLCVSQIALVTYRRARAVRITYNSYGLLACTCCTYHRSLLWHTGVHVLYVSQITLVTYWRARAVRITDHSCRIPMSHVSLSLSRNCHKRLGNESCVISLMLSRMCYHSCGMNSQCLAYHCRCHAIVLQKARPLAVSTRCMYHASPAA